MDVGTPPSPFLAAPSLVLPLVRSLLGERLAQLEELLSHDEWQPVDARVALWRELRLICDAVPHLHSHLSTPADVEMTAAYWAAPPCAMCGSLLDGAFDEDSTSYRCEPCAAAATRSTAGLEELHLELLVTQSLDFRDVMRLAATCAGARRAVQHGPLHLITDIKRAITVDHLGCLLQALQWCGASVQTLRLDQQPTVLWAPPGLEGDDRRRAWEEKMSRMPYPNLETLRTIRLCCPNLRVLGIDDWVAYGGSDPQWRASIAAELAQFPQLRCVHAPCQAWSEEDDRPLAELLQACPHLTQLSVPVSYPRQARAVCESPHAARLLQLSLFRATAAEVSLLCKCSSLRRLHLAECAVDGIDLTTALPRGLTVLTMSDCTGHAARSVPACARSHFAELKWFDLGFSVDAFRSDFLLDVVCRLPRLLVLDLCNTDFTDTMLCSVVEHCKHLHTLAITYAEVTASGFETLQSVAALPYLRHLLYWNSSYEHPEGLQDFFTMDIEELNASLLADLDEMVSFDWASLEYDVPEEEHILAWHAYMTVVVMRRLVVPVVGGSLEDVLPWQMHAICQDYFRLN